MIYGGGEKRREKRAYIEPYDTGTFLEFALGGEEYRFNLLDTSPGGMGMLVNEKQKDVLKKLNVGDKIRMKYGKPDISSVFFNFRIKHVSRIKRGDFKGHFQVGLSLLMKPE